MILTRTFGGIVSANISTAFAYVADVTTPENRSKGMGLIGAAFGLGFVAGPAIGGILSQYGRGYPCYLAAALGIVNIVWALTRLEESLPPERRGARRESRLVVLRELFADRNMAVLLVLMFLATFAFAHMEQSLALYLGLSTAKGGRGFTEREVGYAFGVIGVVSVFVQGGLIRPLSKAFVERSLTLAGWVFLALGLTGIGWFGWASQPLAMVALSGVLVALGQGIANPSLSALVSKGAPPEAQGRAFGASQSMASLARVVGPMSAGWVGHWFGASAPLYVAAGGVVVAFVVLYTSRVSGGRPGLAREGTGC
jgi:DHA1 family tetracycline resistance protein-like MFS transporter